MRYKQLVETKLEQIQNTVMSLESLISGNTTRQEMKSYTDRVKILIEEVQSLIQKEN